MNHVGKLSLYYLALGLWKFGFLKSGFVTVSFCGWIDFWKVRIVCHNFPLNNNCKRSFHVKLQQQVIGLLTQVFSSEPSKSPQKQAGIGWYCGWSFATTVFCSGKGINFILTFKNTRIE